MDTAQIEDVEQAATEPEDPAALPPKQELALQAVLSHRTLKGRPKPPG